MGYSAPIVALSAFAEESNIKDCMDCGMDMFMRSVGANEEHASNVRSAADEISKPIRRPALKQVLSKFSAIIEETELGS